MARTRSAFLAPAEAVIARRIARDLALEPGGPPTLEARITSAWIRPALKWIWAASPDTPESLAVARRLVEAVGRRPIPPGVSISRVAFDGFSGEWVRAGRAAGTAGKAFLYLHGGGYFFGSRRMYRPLTWRLSAATRRPVLAIDYRMMPEHTLGDALDDAVSAYRALLARGIAAADIVLGGDSAGGHLTLVTLLTLRDRGLPLPGAAVCISPWADMAAAAPSRWTNRRSDALIPAAKLAWLGVQYCAGRDPADPLLSPVHGDFTGLPPLLVVYSASEILADDARRVAARAEQAGVEVTVQCWEGVLHAFPVLADLIPEGRAVFRHIAGFVADREASAARSASRPLSVSGGEADRAEQLDQGPANGEPALG